MTFSNWGVYLRGGSTDGTGYTPTKASKIIDSITPPAEVAIPSNQTGRVNTIMRFGTYTLPVPGDVYSQWIDQIRMEHGFAKQDVRNATARKLGIDND